jgi:hypothetical protein
VAGDQIKRHSAEIPLLVVGTVIVVAAIPTLAILIFENFGIWWVVVFLFAFFGLYLARGFLNAYERASSVLITESQLPEVHARIVHFAGKFVLKEVSRTPTWPRTAELSTPSPRNTTGKTSSGELGHLQGGNI